MKMKYYLLSIIILFMISVGCSVNNSTGLISVSNHSTTASINVSLQSTLTILSSGAKADYWFYNDLSGKIVISRVDEIMVAKEYDPLNGTIQYSNDNECKFKLGYRYEIRITKITISNDYIYDSLLIAYIEPGIQPGRKKSDAKFFHYPAN